MHVERKLSTVPKSILLVLILALASQFYLKQIEPPPEFSFTPLPQPLSHNQYRVLSMGSEKLVTHLLTLGVQLHDNQAGKHVNYRHLDYNVLAKTLIQLQTMNPESDYPALLAARVFVNTPDQQQLKTIIHSQQKLFAINPQANWRWMAETIVLAKYHLADLPLALTMAKQLARQPKSVIMPNWARDLEFLLLEELNQFESAIFIIEKMLQGKDQLSNDEVRFLEFRLSALKQKSVEYSTN